jgi:hypothetical protein
MLQQRLSVCVSVRRPESKSFGDRVFSALLGVPGLEAGENCFLLPNLPGNQKTDRVIEKKVSHHVMQRIFPARLVGTGQSWCPTVHVVLCLAKAIARSA